MAPINKTGRRPSLKALNFKLKTLLFHVLIFGRLKNGEKVTQMHSPASNSN
jgi:hypothetical protein